MNFLDRIILDGMKKSDSTDTWMSVTITYSDDGVKPGYGGYCGYKAFSSEITILTKYEGDVGLEKHELTHNQQYGRLLWGHLVLKKVSKKYCLWIELEAYRQQVMCYDYETEAEYEWIISALLNPDKYGLDLDYDQAKEYADYMFEDLLKKNRSN